MENQNDQNQNHTPPVSPVGQTPPIQTPPVSKQKSKLPVGIIIGIILFLIVAGSTAGFYVFKQQSLKTALKPVPSVIPDVTRNPPSPSPDPTANWKTYTDKELGFSIKYPTTILKDRREICTNDASGLGLHDLRYKKEWEENPNQFCVVASPELTIDVFSNKPQEKSDEYWTVVEETILLDGISVEKLTSTRTDKIYEGTSSPYKKTVQYEINKGNRQFSIF